jgi:signal peptidase I
MMTIQPGDASKTDDSSDTTRVDQTGSGAVAAVWAWVRTLGTSAVYATLIITFVGQVARVEGFSMEPTLRDQDRLIVNKLVYRWSPPRVGDIVMLVSPEEPDKLLVKRVVAGPLDVVQSIDGEILRNGTPLPDEYLEPTRRSTDSWGPRVVPRGHYFVLGDHRSNSADSRILGPIPHRYIQGRVQARWWPLFSSRWF